MLQTIDAHKICMVLACNAFLAYPVQMEVHKTLCVYMSVSQGGSPLVVAQTRAHDGAEVLLFVATKTACIKGCFPVLQNYGAGIYCPFTHKTSGVDTDMKGSSV